MLKVLGTAVLRTWRGLQDDESRRKGGCPVTAGLSTRGKDAQRRKKERRTMVTGGGSQLCLLQAGKALESERRC